jgi:preprotein translocase subunit SecE
VNLLHILRLQSILEVPRMRRLTNFLGDVGREMKKVSWPKRDELFRSTLTVITTVAFFAIFFALIDSGLSKLIRLILE